MSFHPPVPLPFPFPPPSSPPYSSSSSPPLPPFLYSLLTYRCSPCCPHVSCVYSLLRGLRQGLVYGAKIRFPHALVMTFLFREGSLTDKFSDILTATWTHSRNLGLFVFTYKFLGCVVRAIRQKNDELSIAIAGGIGGAIIFGPSNPVNSQINMYVMSRVLFGYSRILYSKGFIPQVIFDNSSWIFAAITWASVMFLFQFHTEKLQKSLVTSMDYLYWQSDKTITVSTNQTQSVFPNILSQSTATSPSKSMESVVSLSLFGLLESLWRE